MKVDYFFREKINGFFLRIERQREKRIAPINNIEHQVVYLPKFYGTINIVTTNTSYADQGF